jgi:signal transduction histidine kinase
VIGFAAVLLKNSGQNLSPQQLLYLKRIRDNGVHLLALVDHLVHTTDSGDGERRARLAPVAVERLVRGTMRDIASEAAHDEVTLTTELPSDVAPLTTDEHRFELALRSLVRGALPLAEGGRMTVRLAASQGRAERIDVDVTGPALERIPDADAQPVPLPAELTLATSLYQMLGYAVTTERAAPDAARIRVKLGEPATLVPAPLDD